MTTSAQAEGAIEGVYTDYKLTGQLSTDFAFSRYSRVRQAPTALAMRSASTSEWDGNKGSWTGRKRVL